MLLLNSISHFACMHLAGSLSMWILRSLSADLKKMETSIIDFEQSAFFSKIVKIELSVPNEKISVLRFLWPGGSIL